MSARRHRIPVLLGALMAFAPGLARADGLEGMVSFLFGGMAVVIVAVVVVIVAALARMQTTAKVGGVVLMLLGFLATGLSPVVGIGCMLLGAAGMVLAMRPESRSARDEKLWLLKPPTSEDSSASRRGSRFG